MLQKITNTFYPAMTQLKLVQYFGGHVEAPTRLQKVTEVAVKFNVKNVDGQWEQILAFEGESVLEAISRANVRGLNYTRLCNGADITYRPHKRPVDPFTLGPFCGGCRIILKDNWFDRVKQQTGSYVQCEKQILLAEPDHREDMRLSCCLPVEKWMDGCTFEVAPDTEISEMTKLI